ncbi:hypothetical protein AVEN_138292-1 [Araneus ventricosus]|uniref:Uncharacterized protein n=1 Tax=Araneus ventricosus TaxID=182803 RepID=A0A4Y2G4J8_ARAVE|nr:hypothetical protein AVEN_138292-1 [Araneus ventricosus]
MFSGIATVFSNSRHSKVQLSDEVQHRSKQHLLRYGRHMCMTSFIIGNDRGLSWYTFDFKNPHNQKSQGVRSGNLEGHACGKVRLITVSSPSTERLRQMRYAPYCKNVTCAVPVALQFWNDVL